jgi:hypothetical protein
LFTEGLDGLREFALKAENDLSRLKQLGDHSGRRGLTADPQKSRCKKLSVKKKNSPQRHRVHRDRSIY